MKYTYGFTVGPGALEGKADVLLNVEIVRRNEDGSEEIVMVWAVNPRVGGTFGVPAGVGPYTGWDFFLRGAESIPDEYLSFAVKDWKEHWSQQ